MRKFNLKDKAAERMMNPEAEKPAAEPKEERAESPVSGFSIASRTDVGRVRKSNQDALIIGEGIAGVADGMGGHNGGEIASGETRDGILRELQGKTPDRQVLEEAVKKVNLEVWERQEKDAALTGMGTTLTLLWPGEKEMLIAQVGDSRAYLIRDGKMRQVTEDHSLVGDMVRRGVLTEEQAACHPMRNYITRAVGTEDAIEVDLYCEERKKGDRWLICSDGLYSQITKTALEEAAQTEDPETAADRLLQAALEGGGKDNITLILMTDETEIETEAASDETKTGEAEA
ncbi:MAG: Stp1/IreP family PP2C-type Ser/Thr phosphatase [Clostridia bacterium]|nr:Stp1/IreP family PP2C-type Ser/Thr phosphatase [Clostridia bacterium]